ncbi:MAG: MBL fold metallo-hydrolase [Bacteroidales bacterium]|nr:MBL fold metallo-hydrolase [Bacteroidales bacterium]
MKRRNFLKIAAASSIAVAASPLSVFGNDQVPPQRPPRGANGGGRPGGFPPMEEGPKEYVPTGEGIHVRFLGTGAADWWGPKEDGELRRNASALFDRKVLIDFTDTAKDMVPSGVKPEVIFYTHSHNDHYRPKAALELGIKRVYLGETWLDRAKEDFRKASEETGLPIPSITPLKIGQSIEEEGLKITALPANHASNYLDEQTLIYLIEKDSARILYATDTGGIPAIAAQLAGIDRHVRGNSFITGLIMEATMGFGHEEDYRIFTHSSIKTVETTVKVLSDTGKYIPANGQSVYLTHMARTLHGSQAELDRDLPSPIKAAFDGLEVLFP